MTAIPHEVGGTGPVGAEGYAEQEETALRRGYGIGLFNLDRESVHGRHRHSIAAGLAIGRSYLDRLRYEAIASTSIHLLSDWERILGLREPPSAWGYEERWERIKARCREAKGNNPAVLKAVFERLVGDTVYVVEMWTYKSFVPTPVFPANRFNVVVLVPQAAFDDADTWVECLRAALRLEHAHGRTVVAVTNDGHATEPRPEFRCGVSLVGRDALGLNP
jgi:hypothetical protein